MTENTTNSATEDTFPWSLKVRRDVAMLTLGLDREQFFSLKLRRRKVGATTFYDPEQITALMQLRDHWRKTAAS
jgi:hypothetical protein